ncbi:uncharacterized protein BDW43DRAFT_82414 [Aspergillus alliaceus]|uniref:uncharacterized protein n=1 Tax=Petromyces alliaceus TaxID=209559 RepID=UPI0012A5ACC4|nr:uncharacterized protein BDW43DRAFT_82414 [Aspergillus alliaceus]KAB8233614.1 hypothetical protein BDW43DRAFT_82414 [Aspergillus alliaceus]
MSVLLMKVYILITTWQRIDLRHSMVNMNGGFLLFFFSIIPPIIIYLNAYSIDLFSET